MNRASGTYGTIAKDLIFMLETQERKKRKEPKKVLEQIMVEKLPKLQET